ncbi:hypothetical protein [uncultured Clostridium sp.]|uniref:hypothetical protein n=1 Tax=uncultured Clostridium sp. TaxID=59620 RepID=UPI0025EE66F4|nr:hypothetical protein [uncultured Clostridium sp.]
MDENIKATGAKATKRGSGKKSGGIKPLDLIESGIKIFDQISNLTKTIVEEKNKTERARIETDRIKNDSNERLRTLEMSLQKDMANMNKELEIYREDIKVKLKNIDKEIDKNRGNYETTQLKLKLDHEVNMKLIDEQGRVLDKVLDIYSKYYDAILSGNKIPISPDFIFKDMQNCIDTLKQSISIMSGQNRIIDAEFIEK